MTYLCILLHGYGERGAHMLSRFENGLADQGILTLAPDAPGACKDFPGGFDWLRSDDGWTPKNIHDALITAQHWVNDMCDNALKDYGLHDNQLVLAGYSQGARIALQAGLHRSACAGIIGINGALFQPEHALTPPLPNVPICLIHGKDDDIVPVKHHHHAMTLLAEEGLPVTEHLLDNQGHRFSTQLINAVLDEIRTLTSTSQ